QSEVSAVHQDLAAPAAPDGEFPRGPPRPPPDVTPMEELLFLAHRIPYPPNKGDKVRSYHLVRFLAEHFRVHLGAFVDEPDDWKHVDVLRDWCASVHLVPLSRRWATLRSAS